MAETTIVPVSRMRRFDAPGAPQASTPAPLSPIVLGRLIEAVTKLDKKIDAIVLSRTQYPEVSATQSTALQAPAPARASRSLAGSLMKSVNALAKRVATVENHQQLYDVTTIQPQAGPRRAVQTVDPKPQRTVRVKRSILREMFD